MFDKLHKFIGKDIEKLLERADGRWCFRLHKKKIYYCREALMKKATCIARDNLVAMGTQIGKITHSGRFILTITALDVLAQYAKYKVWVKPSAEMSFLYGNHITKSGTCAVQCSRAVLIAHAQQPGGTPVVAHPASALPRALSHRHRPWPHHRGSGAARRGGRVQHEQCAARVRVGCAVHGLLPHVGPDWLRRAAPSGRGRVLAHRDVAQLSARRGCGRMGSHVRIASARLCG